VIGTIDHRRDRRKPWRARYPAPNGKQPSRSFATKAEAQRWLRAEIRKIDQGEWVNPAGGRLRYADHAEGWLDGLVGVKQKTRAGYQNLLHSRVLPVFGDHPLRHIRPANVRGWVAAMVDEGLSASRIRQAHQVLRASLDQAVTDGLIGRNPAAGVKLPTPRPKDMTVLTSEEVRRLAAEAETRSPGAGTLITVLAFTGLRWGEVVALRVDSLNILRRQVNVRAAATEIGGRLVFGTPKTHRVRTVILPRAVADLLAAHLAAKAPGDLVFTSPEGRPLRGGNFRKKVWKPATSIALPNTEDLTLHDLRHTAASLAISCGANIKAVQRMLGHKHASMTLDVYGHLYTEDLEDLANRLDERIRGVA
jgi:integrase